uniref:Probable ATP-dependent RNA helicase DDX52 n=1 Tax=Ciona savignyi TaxID=51511 RepID=H2YM54_CIOSA
TPIQMQAIPAMLHGREVLASAPTGSGKTLAFLIPVKKKKRKNVIRALILSPTRELAEQTYQECQKLIQLPENTVENSDLNQLLNNQVGPEIDLLISTPNRIIYLLNQSMLDLSTTEWLVVDESDKLFEDGKKDFSFREQLGQIYSGCENPGIRRAMFSATFAHAVQRWCIMNMDNVLQITVGGKNTAAKSVEQELKYVGNEDGKLMALEEIIRKGFSPPALVFVQSKERAKELFAELVYDGLRIDVIHGDRSAEERDRAIEGLRSGRTWLLICTEHMGRGMDFKDVNLVVNYDFPRSAVTYIHRVGRTGRAGQTGRAITMFTDEDRPLLRSIANVVKEAGCYVPEYMLKMKKLGKDQRRKVAKTQLKRKTIRTAPAEILNSGKAKKFKRKLKNE